MYLMLVRACVKQYVPTTFLQTIPNTKGVLALITAILLFYRFLQRASYTFLFVL